MRKDTFVPRPVSEYDLRLLRIFKVVVECGGFAKAEPVLNITRSTISVHISNLESRMKFKLAKRGRGGFALTEQGKVVYEASLKLFDTLNGFSVLISSLDVEVSGELVILCSDNVAVSPQLRLPEVIATLNDRAPKLQIAINNDTAPSIENALLAGQAHVGIMPEFRNIDALSYQPNFEERFILCCGNKHPFFTLSDDDISDEMLHASQTVYPGVDVNSAGIEQLRRLNLSARAYQFDTRTPLVLSGRYLGFFPLSYIQPYIDRGQVRLVQPAERYYDLRHVIVHRQSSVMDTKVRLFLDVCDELARSPAS
jgi:DNA-binding transcriptional LysR family regulator